MKFLKITLLVVMSGVFTSFVNAQTDRVSFIHGLNSEPSVWNTMDSELSSIFDFSSSNISYASNNFISGSASTVFIPDGSVVVAHSEGGLLAREYLRQKGNDKLKALITVGTPNLGAPIANNIANGKVVSTVENWLEDLSAGPRYFAGPLFGDSFAQNVLDYLNISGTSLATRFLDSYLLSNYETSSAVNDMKVGSQFMNTLNANPNSTLPNARYAIYGVEQFQSHVRLITSVNRQNNNGNPVETGQGLVPYYYATSVYFFVTLYSLYTAYQFYYYYINSDFSDPYYFFYYDQYQYWLGAGKEWGKGLITLAGKMHFDWETQIVGSDFSLSRLDLEESDAFIPKRSQAPGFFEISGDGIFRILKANGANHVEETHHPSVKNRLEQIFVFSDVNIPKITGNGGGIDPPPPPPEDCFPLFVCPTEN